MKAPLVQRTRHARHKQQSTHLRVSISFSKTLHNRDGSITVLAVY